MKVNLLAINIGNSRTQLGTFVEGELEAVEVLDNKGPQRLIGPALIQAFTPLRGLSRVFVVMSSVNPPVTERLKTEIEEHLRVTPVLVEKDLPIPVGRQLDPETIVGDDRLLNAAAAFHVLKQACVVVDAGTAITIDFIDGTGTFHGGAIGPGAQMMLDAMHDRTAQLPEVQFDVPEEAIGHNTAEAMKTAVFHGLRGMVRELVEQYAAEIGSFPMVVATGGDAETLFDDYDLIERVVPELTLLGIALTMSSAVEQAEER
ncbi:MAG: type III pantothenate kinase [Phycisphaeraceae bacterium]|nr:type III pantothenate kinase [Phycisphaeraceae bacterium]